MTFRLDYKNRKTQENALSLYPRPNLQILWRARCFALPILSCNTCFNPPRKFPGKFDYVLKKRLFLLDSPYAVKIIKKVWLVFEYTADKKVGKNVFCSPGSHRIYNIHPQQYYRERTMCGQVKNSLIYSFMKLHVINVTVNYADILIFF